MDVAETRKAIEALLGSLSGRLPASEIEMAREDLSAGEWHLAFEAVLAALDADGVAVTEPERAELLRLAEELGVDGDAVGELLPHPPRRS